MKIVLLAGLLLAPCLSVQAQNKVMFGVQAGALINDQRYQTLQVDRPLTPRAYQATQNANNRHGALSYLIGATAHYPLTDHFSVGLNLSWYRSGSTNRRRYTVLDGAKQEYSAVERYRFQYIQLPVWLQYTATKFQSRPYIRTGPTYTYLLNPGLSVASTYTDNTRTPSISSASFTQDLPYKGGYGGSFPHHDWQVMTEVGLSVSKHVKLGVRYDLLARQRTIVQIGAADGPVYHSFRNRNVGLLTEISF